MLEPETRLRVVSVCAESESDSASRGVFKIVVEAMETQRLSLENAVRQFTLNAPIPGMWTREIDPVTQKIYYLNFMANKARIAYPAKITPADIFKQTPRTAGAAGTEVPTQQLGAKRASASEIPIPSLRISTVAKNSVSLIWDPVPRVLGKETVYTVMRQIPGIDTTMTYAYRGKGTSTTGEGLIAGVTYQYRIRAGTLEKKANSGNGSSVAEMWGPWSERLVITTPKASFLECAWRPCDISYAVSGFPARFATKTSEDSSRSVILGNTALGEGGWYSWSVRIVRSRANNGEGIYVGVAPVDGSAAMGKLHGWYLYCKNVSPFSDPTTDYDEPAAFTPPAGGVHSGSVIGFKMDTVTGKLFFSIDGVETGIYFYGIPLDDGVPLVPSVALNCKDDIVELIVQ